MKIKKTSAECAEYNFHNFSAIEHGLLEPWEPEPLTTYDLSYWNRRGKHELIAEKLAELIPAEGNCPRNLPKLDKFRRASNCYYDLFNNGLCNRAAEFKRIFGFSPKTQYRKGGYQGTYPSIDFQNIRMHERLNATLDLIIEEASAENGIDI